MDKGFANLLQFVRKLSPHQQERLFLTLKSIVEPKSAAKGSLIGELRETKFKEGFVCPHCDGRRVVRYGKFNLRQRYKCKECLRTFSDLTHSPLSKTRYPDKWISFIECMLQGHSLRKSAHLVGVTWVTLFYWRHKLLKTLQQIDIPSFQGIVEMDETYFLYSQKGHRNITDRKPRKRGGSAKLRGISHEQVCVLVARDRAKRTISKVTCMGRILKTQVDRVVGKKLSSTNVLCTDAWRAYKTYAKEKAIPHYRLKSNEGTHVIKGIYHIQNVNSYHSRLKQWLYRFKGVASKYLDHYLAWFRFLEARGHENSIHNLKEMLMSACTYRINETYKTLRLSTFSIS